MRDWLYVDDHADAWLLVLEKGKAGRSYNIGNESESTNLNVCMQHCEGLYILPPQSEEPVI